VACYRGGVPPARRAADVAAFRAHLVSEGYAAVTVRVYAHAVDAWLASRQPADAYVRRAVTPKTPQGKATVIRAALRAWGAWRGEPMPEVPVGASSTRAPRTRVLGSVDLERYHAAVEAHTDPSTRAVLHMLPVAVLKLCILCAAPRRVPEPWRRSPWVGEEYLLFAPPSPWLFPSAHDPQVHVSPAVVQDALRSQRDSAAWTAFALWRVGSGQVSTSPP
jgi:hypothetical protein